MAQRKPEEKVTVDRVLKLVDSLSGEERQELYRKLNLISWGERWRGLCAKVDAQNQSLPQLTEEEILTDMRAIRQELKAERGQGGS